MRGSFMKRLLCVILVVAMIAANAIPTYAAEHETASFQQVGNDRVSASFFDKEAAELPEEEDPYDARDVVRVSIILEKAGTIEAGYSIMDIAKNFAAMNYRSRIERDQADIVSMIEKVIKRDLDVVWNLTLAANLISAYVEYGEIKDIEKTEGVKSVVIETRYEPDVVSTGPADPNMATSGVQIGSAAAWAAGYTGAGSTIAVIDTGLDIEHEAFDAAAFEYSLSQLDGEYDLMDASDISAVLTELNAYNRYVGASAENLYVNAKIPFGFNYVDEDLDIVHVNDGQGEHGSHVAGIAAANAYVSNSDGTFSSALDTTFVQGVAPDAQLLVMKVFGKNGGAFDSDYMAAIEDAVVLGAESINISLGSGNPGMSNASGSSEELGAYQTILENLEKSGVVVAFSAGNSGYWSESAENGMPYLYLDDVSFQTNGSPGSYTNAFTVASVDNDGFTATYFDVGGSIVAYNDNQGYGNEPMTTLAGTREYVFVNTIGEPADFAAVGSEILEGKIVLCYRGTTSFFEKANAAAAAGAAGVIVVNNQAGIINMDLTGYEYTVPVVSITLADGEAFKNVGTKYTTESGIEYWTGSMDIADSLGHGQYNSDYYTMSSFSSWGVPGSLELKPEITAPGGNIYSVAGANVTDGKLLFSDHESYELMSGTSMASPQVAGMAALMAQYIRETGLDEKTGLDERTLTQSLLMSTAVPMIDGTGSGTYYPVIQQGAGLANVGAATTADSYILMDKNATASYADGKVKAELGDDPDKTGKYSFSFTINNLTDEEKFYALSADTFTQSAFAYDNVLFLDTWATDLTPSVAWTVNGKAVSAGEELSGLDFNGDGIVNTADGQHLLDYATGLEVTLSNKDKADLNEDGKINSYDAYLFFTKLNASGAVVPANGSAQVTVTITLSQDDRQWLAYYENGAYIQAYVYAESVSTDEGVAGTTHSIPMLAYYGNWSDPSMFDKGSYVEFANGLETRAPYLYESAYSQGKYNGLLVKYADMDGEYWFGGNPLVPDETYMPERNAISAARGDKISKIGFTSIRNAADSYYQVINADTGEALINDSVGEVPSAYYYVSGDTWMGTFYTLKTDFAPTRITEGTTIDVGLTLIPEYYIDGEGNVNWAELGDGVSFSMPMVIDNTAPAILDVDVDAENYLLNVVAEDNQYISAVALYDLTGNAVFTYTGADPEQAEGDEVTFALDLSEVNGTGFLLQVYDYAMNTATYEIQMQIGEVTDEVSGITLNKTSLVMYTGDTATLIATVEPLNATNRAVVWSSSDESVVTVDENGKLTAVAVGNAVITAAAAADETITAACAVEVIKINGKLNGIVWDEEGSIWFSEFDVNGLPAYEKLSPDMLEEDYFVATAISPDGTMYASTQNTSTDTGSLYTIDPATYEATLLNNIVVQGTSIFYADMTYAPAMFETGMLLGVYGPYVLAIDPTNGKVLEIIDELDSDIVGITTADSYLRQASDGTIVYEDYVYLILNDGTVVLENYYGYNGVIVPYYDYFEGTRMTMESGVSVNDAWYFNSAYYNGEYLYWSAFDIKTQNEVTLYAIDVNTTGNVYTLGQFDEGVWPVAGLHELGAAEEALATESDEPIMAIGDVADIQLVPKSFPVKEAKVGGSLNAIGNQGITVTPLSKSDVNASDDTVTVTVTAKDANGDAVASTNGVSTVTYDTEVLELVDVQVAGDYTAVNEGDGKVTFGYVDMEGIPADETIATLIFNVKAEEDTTVTVTTEEVGDQDSGYSEELEADIFCEHVWADPVFDWAEDYTTCTVTYTCANGCGETATYDCAVTSETTEPTCDVDGKTVYTAVYGEDSDTAEEVIPATGHDYHDGICGNCGGEDPDYQEPTEPTDPSVPTEPEKPNKPGTGSFWDWIFGGWWGKKCEHTYTSVVTAATCEKKGYTTHTCSKCGDSYKDTYTNALGHDWDEGEVTKEATCTANGVKTYTCDRCDKTKTEAIKATGHDYHDGVCGNCGKEESTKPGRPGTGGFWDWLFGWWR